MKYFLLDRINRMNRDFTAILAPSAKRIMYCRFHPETGNIKYPNNPVNPVYFKKIK